MMQPKHKMCHGTGQLTKEAVQAAYESILANHKPSQDWVIHPPIVWKIRVKKESTMEKIERKMARFVELSYKFTAKTEDIGEFDVIEKLIEYGKTAPDVTWTDQEGSSVRLTQEDIPQITEKAKLQAGVKHIGTIFDEYTEFLELRAVLNEYFVAAGKL